MTGETAVEEALRSRADLRSAETSVQAAALTVRAQKAQRLPVISVTADYGGAGANIGNFNQVYTVAGNISVPIYTGGRIHADIEQAQADLARRQAEYEDLKGRVTYDVRVAWLDLTALVSRCQILRKARAFERPLANPRLLFRWSLPCHFPPRSSGSLTSALPTARAKEISATSNENRL